MKSRPSEATPRTVATVEFEVQFSRGPKGRKRLPASPSVAATPMMTPPASPPAATRSTVVGMTPTSATPPVSTSPAVAATPAPEPVPAASRAAPLPVTVLEASPHAEQPAPGPRVPKITQLLVLAWHFERLVREGALKDLAEVARRTGLTRARVTQIANLLLLAPDIQEAILTLPVVADRTDPVHERTLRTVVAKLEWSQQRLLWSHLGRPPQSPNTPAPSARVSTGRRGCVHDMPDVVEKSAVPHVAVQNLFKNEGFRKALKQR